MINFKEFIWVLTNDNNTVLKKKSFSTLKEEIQLKKLVSTARTYYISVFAINSRFGKSQIVEIKIEIK